ncbi:MAG: 2'-5' RNA ligase family protein [Prosthecobacter sp.]|uniref:2'-5' RNA ligase family protein n=1 Tax=Prosthecobacter sp. TaxID=1965333 RepID=UPI003BB0BA4C
MPAALEEQPVTSVFLAILPDQVAAEQIARCACEVKARHGLKGAPRPTGRFHVTLHTFDHAPHALERSVQMAQMVAAKVVKGVSPFEVRFDRVKSFSEKKSNCPCVLADREGNEALRAFASRLKREMGKPAGHFTPHVTLLYDDTIVKEEYVEPVIWTVHEIVLLKAIMKRKTFQELGRWTLQG